MMTKTSELAFRALLTLALDADGRPVSPKRLAAVLDASPTYLGKTLGMLVKSGILSSVRGSHGGVLLLRAPGEISLLEIVQACQGAIVPDYCRAKAAPAQTCAYHVAMRELHEQIVAVLGRWTLAELLSRPRGTGAARESCRMSLPTKPTAPTTARRKQA